MTAASTLQQLNNAHWVQLLKVFSTESFTLSYVKFYSKYKLLVRYFHIFSFKNAKAVALRMFCRKDAVEYYDYDFLWKSMSFLNMDSISNDFLWILKRFWEQLFYGHLWVTASEKYHNKCYCSQMFLFRYFINLETTQFACWNETF